MHQYIFGLFCALLLTWFNWVYVFLIYYILFYFTLIYRVLQSVYLLHFIFCLKRMLCMSENYIRQIITLFAGIYIIYLIYFVVAGSIKNVANMLHLVNIRILSMLIFVFIWTYASFSWLLIYWNSFLTILIT
jgi:hypothetical protein